MIDVNLIEAYDRLMAFCMKHMDNRHVLDGDISVDARQLIDREVVGNILIHRDYSNAFPAKLIIDREALHTENWSKSRFNGPLSIENFSPYPKNPLLSAFFVNIGRADTLGSGMRNLYKYTKLYSHTEPLLTEGDVFEIWIPLKKSEVDAKKSEVDIKKSEVELKTPDEKVSLDTLLAKCRENSYNATVLNNMEKVYSEIITDQVFGASDIEKILGCAESTAAEMMRRLRDMKVVLSISGMGKGKYRFKYESEME